MISLKYSATNTFFIPGGRGGLLIDTGYAGSIQAFFKAIKAQGIRVSDIRFVMATHYHPDHMGLIGELVDMGTGLLLVDTQKGYVHFSDGIFARDGLAHYKPVDEGRAVVISCDESRGFLSGLGFSGEIFSTPSHSADSVSVYLDSGECIVGDLEPYEYLAAYGENIPMKRDWERVMSFSPRVVYYAHANERVMQTG